MRSDARPQADYDPHRMATTERGARVGRQLRRLAGRSGIVCAVLAGVVLAAGSAADATPRCNWKVYGPQTRSKGRSTVLVAKASFYCSVPYRGARVTVAIQKRVHGHWRYVAETHKTTDVSAGHTFIVRASVPCQPTLGFTGVMIRTFSAASTRAGRIKLASAPENALCRFGAPSAG